MGKRDDRWHDESLSEHYDLDSIRLIQECEVLKLIKFFIRNLDRLHNLVLEARKEANRLALEQQGTWLPYPIPVEDIFDGSLCDYPEILRYYKVYGVK